MENKVKEIYLKDYTEPSYWIKNTDLLFEIYDEYTIVTTKLDLHKNENINNITELKLNGVDLEIIEISLNDKVLNSYDYSYNKEHLVIQTQENRIILESKVKIYPDKNFSCEGLYRSGTILCTQNEAEGFRKITFFDDRPDNMSVFKTTIISDKKKYPYILSNGNLESTHELPEGLHKTVWNDPYAKPCYLFAVVAGDLGRVQDEFITSSGKKVKLEIYVDHGNEDKTKHAMESLKNSMKWDEERFGLEYDLDRYMIVAVDSFNMGAMENKGLNIFNSHYVLAKPETAHDKNFQGIESVIGHEYFHNWTGNRVTCRDWFQLTLKEGLTVFRDQEFSSDMGSRAVKLIDDIKTLRLHQFPEDNGPLSHPIQPKSYSEINNFYTSTVYEKGAQVIRMIETIIGRENFRKGMDLYFERFDGMAVTTDDFVQSMSDASNIDLDHFKVWYDQNGTPELKIKTDYDDKTKEYSISVDQIVETNNSKYDSLYIPFYFNLLDENGDNLLTENNGKYILNKKNQKIVLKNIPKNCIPVWNREFSAPIKINYEYSFSELLIIMKSTADNFGQYDAAQNIYQKEISRLVSCLHEGRELEVDRRLIESIKFILELSEMDLEFKSYLIDIPTEKALFENIKDYDFENYHTARNFLIKSIGLELNDLFTHMVSQLDDKKEYDISAGSIAKRALKNKMISFMAATNSPTNFDLIFNMYQNANNMTDEISAFNCLLHYDNPYQNKVKNSFYDKWSGDTLVIQKWLSSISLSPNTKASDLKEYEELEVYDNKVPNLVRALYNGFLFYNVNQLNHSSGEGYETIVSKIIEIDQFNPQLAARMTKGLNFGEKLKDERKNLLKDQLNRLRETKKLSNDTLEIVSKNLACF